MGHYHSVSSAVYAKIVRQRAAAVEARHAGRQAAHDTAASARAAAKREERRLAIANRPRGQTRVIDHRDDGSPVYSTIAAFRARPYVEPEKRTEKPAPSTAHGTAAALKAEAPQVPWIDNEHRVAWRAARKVRMARRRRRGF